MFLLKSVTFKTYNSYFYKLKFFMMIFIMYMNLSSCLSCCCHKTKNPPHTHFFLVSNYFIIIKQDPWRLRFFYSIIINMRWKEWRMKEFQKNKCNNINSSKCNSMFILHVPMFFSFQLLQLHLLSFVHPHNTIFAYLVMRHLIWFTTI